ncbi:MAG: hypothetical protein KGS45_04870 [Planctomycetes bacterium]|nr:hypothetical protein [Planctomycetota bacterium]
MSQFFGLQRGSPLFADGSRWAFSRGVETVEPGGAPVAPHQTRFGPPQTLSALPEPEQLIDSGLSIGSQLLHVGFDLDGQRHVIMVYDAPRRNLRIYRETAISSGSFNLHRSITITSFPGLPTGDVLGAASPSSAIGAEAFDVSNGLVVHGTLVLLCRVYVKQASGEWVISGSGIVYSTDLGATWTRYFSDTADPRDIGRGRLSGWELTNFYCPGSTDGEPPLQVVIPFSDYRYAGLPVAAGGRAFWFVMSRSNASQPLLPLTGTGPGGQTVPRMGMFTLDTAPIGPQYTHVHAVTITEYLGGKVPGWQLLLGIGDNVASSILRIIVKDPTRYWEPQHIGGGANWVVQPNWHGRIDSAVYDTTQNNGWGGPGNGSTHANDSTTGNQFVGAAPGPDPGTVLLGVDAMGEGVHICEPGHSEDSRPRMKSTVVDGGVLARANCFYIRTDRPERSQRTVTASMVLSAVMSGRITDAPIDGIWFSRDNGRPGTWGFINLDFCDHRHSLADDHVYLLRGSGTLLVRKPLPVTRAVDPLQIGPGGSQWLRDDPTRLAITGLQVLRCPRDASGQFLVPSSDGTTTLGPITPQPPVKVNAVYRVCKLFNDGNGGRVMSIIPTQTHPSVASALRAQSEIYPTPWTPPDALAPRRMRLRFLTMARTPTLDSPAVAAGRSPAGGYLDMFYDGGPNAVASVGGLWTFSDQDWQWAHRQWTIGVGDKESLLIYSRSNLRSIDTDYFIAFSEFATDTNSSSGYPLPPDIPDCCPGGPDVFSVTPVEATRFPDELAEIRNLNLTGSWTVLAAGLCNIDSWDQFCSQNPNTPGYPLLTLMDPATNRRVVITASTTFGNNLSSGVRVVAGGRTLSAKPLATVGRIPFLRGRPMLFAIVKQANWIRVHAAVSGLMGSTTAISGPLIPPTQVQTLHFGGPADWPFADERVNAAQWVGVRTENRALTDAEVLAQFRSLAFLGS